MQTKGVLLISVKTTVEICHVFRQIRQSDETREDPMIHYHKRTKKKVLQFYKGSYYSKSNCLFEKAGLGKEKEGKFLVQVNKFQCHWVHDVENTCFKCRDKNNVQFNQSLYSIQVHIQSTNREGDKQKTLVTRF